MQCYYEDLVICSHFKAYKGEKGFLKWSVMLVRVKTLQKISEHLIRVHPQTILMKLERNKMTETSIFVQVISIVTPRCIHGQKPPLKALA